MDEVNLTRFLRHSMTNRIFTEVKPGIVAHTAISRVLAEDIMMEHWIGLCVDDLAPVCVHIIFYTWTTNILRSFLIMKVLINSRSHRPQLTR